jgi:ribosomal protein L11 methyltransferase
MSSQYIEVEITADSDLIEHTTGILTQLGFEGFWEDDGVLKCYISARRWTPGLGEEVETVVRRMAPSSGTSRPVVTIRTLDARDWSDEWEKTITPIEITSRIVVKPTWHAVPATPGRIILTIDPKMSFGTGYHETTRLSLRLLEKHIVPACRVLDIGTGTGILAIAAAKLGASHATGIDVDEWSFENAKENVALNAVEHQVRILHGELHDIPPDPYDVIVANIQLNVIRSILPTMMSLLASNGVVILSGLLVADKETISRVLAGSGFRVIDELVENEWVAFAAA